MPRPDHVKPLLWTVIMVLVAAVGVTALSIVYTTRSVRESEQRLCGVLVVLDDAYRAAPSATERGRLLAQAVHRVRLDYGC